MSEDRLDRMEALADKILQGLDETRQRTDSNARAIEALANEWTKDREQWTKDREQWEKDREEWEKDRKGIYLLLGRLTRSMSDFYEIQSDFYNRFDQIDSRQADITEILRELKEDKKKSDKNED